jgi:hypothetical protein
MQMAGTIIMEMNWQWQRLAIAHQSAGTVANLDTNPQIAEHQRPTTSIVRTIVMEVMVIVIVIVMEVVVPEIDAISYAMNAECEGTLEIDASVLQPMHRDAQLVGVHHLDTMATLASKDK